LATGKPGGPTWWMMSDEARWRAGLGIASNRGEKFHDGSVSVRCKHRGMEWTELGLVGLTSREAARRHGQWPQGRATRSLPAWEVPPADRIAAGKRSRGAPTGDRQEPAFSRSARTASQAASRAGRGSEMGLDRSSTI
jgi:hypothetical protein